MELARYEKRARDAAWEVWQRLSDEDRRTLAAAYDVKHREFNTDNECDLGWLCQVSWEFEEYRRRSDEALRRREEALRQQEEMDKMVRQMLESRKRKKRPQ
jgi:hypothetical protein